MKVLSFNTGYFLGYSGTYQEYLTDPLKGVKGSRNEYDNLQEFIDLVESEDPDFVLAQEVDGGSIRTNTSNQHAYLKDKLPEKYSSSFDTKYRGFLFPHAPMLRYMGNSVFFKQGAAEKHSLSIGRKNLVQEIRVNDLSIFSLHLSTLGGWVRKRQIKEISRILENRERYVLAGDLNLHKGRKELDYLEKTLGIPVHSPGKTFPAGNPDRKLDLVANSTEIRVENLQDLGERFSDHRPISFEIDRK